MNPVSLHDIPNAKDAHRLVYAFASFPHMTRMVLARKYIKVSEEEGMSNNHTQVTSAILGRIHETGRITDFMNDVFVEQERRQKDDAK